VLNKIAVTIDNAKTYTEMADRMRREARGMLVDLFGLIESPGSAAYRVDALPHKGSILCLDLRVHYEPDGEKMARVLGDRLELVLTLKPHFDTKKAAAAIKAGWITEAELAKCVTPVARPAAILRDAGDSNSMTPKGIPLGEGRVNPLTLAKGLKLDWGERS
jgi:hypothetical protein